MESKRSEEDSHDLMGLQAAMMQLRSWWRIDGPEKAGKGILLICNRIHLNTFMVAVVLRPVRRRR